MSETKRLLDEDEEETDNGGKLFVSIMKQTMVVS
jgi:hypothetical protein